MKLHVWGKGWEFRCVPHASLLHAVAEGSGAVWAGVGGADEAAGLGVSGGFPHLILRKLNLMRDSYHYLWSKPPFMLLNNMCSPAAGKKKPRCRWQIK